MVGPMMDYCKPLTGCHRKFLLQQFSSEVPSFMKSHHCCNLCTTPVSAQLPSVPIMFHAQQNCVIVLTQVECKNRKRAVTANGKF